MLSKSSFWTSVGGRCFYNTVNKRRASAKPACSETAKQTISNREVNVGKNMQVMLRPCHSFQLHIFEHHNGLCLCWKHDFLEVTAIMGLVPSLQFSHLCKQR